MKPFPFAQDTVFISQSIIFRFRSAPLMVKFMALKKSARTRAEVILVTCELLAGTGTTAADVMNSASPARAAAHAKRGKTRWAAAIPALTAIN